MFWSEKSSNATSGWKPPAELRTFSYGLNPVMLSRKRTWPVCRYKKWSPGTLVVVPLEGGYRMLAGTRTAWSMDSRVVEFSLSVGDDECLVLRVEEDVHSHVGLKASARHQNPTRRRSRFR